MKEDTYHRAISALGRALVAAKPGLTLTQSGSVNHWSDNLLTGTDPTWFEAELRDGDGRELDSKFKAAHSSSALAVNTFARFKTACNQLSLASWSGCETFRFEAKCSAGIRGPPPNLDFLAQSATTVLGIESKCTEHLLKHVANFSSAYNDQIKHGDVRRAST